MKIVVLTQWYPPEPAQLIRELAETLQTSGHEVKVLTGFPNYPSGKLYPGYRIRIKQIDSIGNVDVIRVPLYTNHSRSAIKRMLNYLSFSVSATLLGIWFIPKPDIVFVYHPPLTVGLPAIMLGKLWRVPFVYQIQDMWPETLSATGMVNNRIILGLVGIFAKWIYTRAAAICVISAGFKQNLIKKGVNSKKIHLIENWINPNLCLPQDPERKLKVELGLTGKFNILYAGNIGEAQGLDTVLYAAEELIKNTNIQFVIAGDGVSLPGLKQKCNKLGLHNVTFIGRFEFKDLSRYCALADVLLVHLIDNPLFEITIPSKIYSYMSSGKPVLAALNGDAADLIIKSGAGLTCTPQDSIAMAQLVLKFHCMSESERIKMGANGRSAVLLHNNREYLVGKIDALLRNTMLRTR